MKQTSPNNQPQGFTLVELSIVLVIIGLLIGGILAAQSMIESAKVNKTIKEFQQYNIAALMFQESYNCLPGDCNKNLGVTSTSPALYGFSVYAQGLFNGNGIIGDYDAVFNYGNYGIVSPEAYNFWGTLEQLKYIPITLSHTPHTYNEGHGPGIASPTPPVVTKVMQNSGPNPTMVGGWWVFGMDGHSNQNFPVNPPSCKNVFAITGLVNSSSGVIPNKYSLAIDAKLDDGLPLTGRVFATGYSYGHNGTTFRALSPTNAPWSANCVDTTTTPNSYKASYTGLSYTCDLILCSDF